MLWYTIYIIHCIDESLYDVAPGTYASICEPSHTPDTEPRGFYDVIFKLGFVVAGAGFSCYEKCKR